MPPQGELGENIKNPLETARQEIQDIINSSDPITTLKNTIEERATQKFPFTSSVELRNKLQNGSQGEKEDARTLLTWHCLSTLSHMFD